MSKLTVTRPGDIELREDTIALRGWRFEGLNRDEATEYDIVLAVRTYLVDRLTRSRGLPPLALAEPVEAPVSMQVEIDAEREAAVWINFCQR